MSISKLMIAIDIGLAIAVAGVGIASLANWLLNHMIDPALQQILIALIGLLQARLAVHLVRVRESQKLIENGATKPLDVVVK